MKGNTNDIDTALKGPLISDFVCTLNNGESYHPVTGLVLIWCVHAPVVHVPITRGIVRDLERLRDKLFVI